MRKKFQKTIKKYIFYSSADSVIANEKSAERKTSKTNWLEQKSII